MIETKIIFDIDVLKAKSNEYIIGLDEVGWGSFAGDIVIGACAIPRSFYEKIPDKGDLLHFVDDSKKVKEAKRGPLAEHIEKTFIVGYGRGTVDRINRDGMAEAYRYAFQDAMIDVTGKLPSFKYTAWLDGNKRVLATDYDHNVVVKGDAHSFVVGCASICAKVFRDSYMTKLAAEYPAYDWAKNKGYGSPKHLAGINEHGPCDQHRDKFIKTYRGF